MCAGFGVCHGNITDAIDRELVVEAAVVAEDAAMAMRSVFAEADVGDDEEVGEACSEKSDGLNNGTLWVVCCCAESVFGARCDRDAEEDYGSQTFPDKRF